MKLTTNSKRMGTVTNGVRQAWAHNNNINCTTCPIARKRDLEKQGQRQENVLQRDKEKGQEKQNINIHIQHNWFANKLSHFLFIIMLLCFYIIIKGCN